MFREIEANGPLAASGFDGHKGSGGWWGWSDAKHAFEWLFWAGRITTASREGFQRYYDLPERVLPKAIVEAPEPAAADAQRELLRRSARALGVATISRSARLFPAVAGRREGPHPRTGRGRRVAAGQGRGLGAAGLSAQGRQAAAQRPCGALLSPFDPLVWERSRTERLFDFRYRIEIYTPAAKRVHGYYVLPFLLGDALVGARRPQGRSQGRRAQGAVGLRRAGRAGRDRGGADRPNCAAWPHWLGLERIEISRNGDLAPALADAATV